MVAEWKILRHMRRTAAASRDCKDERRGLGSGLGSGLGLGLEWLGQQVRWDERMGGGRCN